MAAGEVGAEVGTAAGADAYLAGVREAAAALRDVFEPTPLQRNDYLSAKHRRRRLAEARGPEPGPLLQDPRRVQRHAQGAAPRDPGRRRFVCASAGNHAQGMAFACRHFGTEGIVFMPVTTPQQKIDKTRSSAAARVEIRLVGDYFDETLRGGAGLLRRGPGRFPAAVRRCRRDRGPGVLRAEMLDQLPARAPDIVVLPVGGGGLAAGVRAVSAETAPGTELRFVEPAGGASSLTRALAAGRPVTLNQGRQLRRRRGGGADRRPATSRRCADLARRTCCSRPRTASASP